MSVSVETPNWKGQVGMDEDVTFKLLLQGDYEVTWMEKGDLVLSFGWYEGSELPHLLRLLATAVEEAALFDGGPFQ